MCNTLAITFSISVIKLTILQFFHPPLPALSLPVVHKGSSTKSSRETSILSYEELESGATCIRMDGRAYKLQHHLGTSSELLALWCAVRILHSTGEIDREKRCFSAAVRGTALVDDWKITTQLLAFNSATQAEIDKGIRQRNRYENELAQLRTKNSFISRLKTACGHEYERENEPISFTSGPARLI